MKVNIKKDTPETFGPFSGYSQSDTEQKSRIEVVSSGNFEKVIDQFEKFLFHPSRYYDSFEYSRIRTASLTPDEISNFVYFIQDSYNHWNLKRKSGHYISRLLQSSYEDGNNNFVLHLEDFKLSNLGGLIKASKENPLNIEVSGDVGNNFGVDSTNLVATINGKANVGFGHRSTNFLAKVNGDVEYGFCQFTTNMNLTVNGDVTFYFGKYASNSSVSIFGKISNLSKIGLDRTSLFQNVADTTFKITDKESFELIKNNLKNERRIIKYPLSGMINCLFELEYNKLIHIDENQKKLSKVVFL